MDLSGATWRKATRSGNADCVEVAANLPGVVLVRDSKDRDGATLHVTPSSWQSFLALAKQTGPAT
ncbi:DUF397 domain-containing protein [Micromonospora chalcea]|uniref:DUF397 domain-containing protein n=1 Tax=Micromonospora sp. TSRI0369 TaxID=1703936 RepID=UPI00093C3F1A|nr:DUF397 domain-containing protein [Micromonospora sp. TSRI0369]OKJ42030.1 regulator [Micromonospora sp. TSRI0369]